MFKLLLFVVALQVSCTSLTPVKDKDAIEICHQTGNCPNELNEINGNTNKAHDRSAQADEIDGPNSTQDDMAEVHAYHYQPEAWNPMPINFKHNILYGNRENP